MRTHLQLLYTSSVILLNISIAAYWQFTRRNVISILYGKKGSFLHL